MLSDVALRCLTDAAYRGDPLSSRETLDLLKEILELRAEREKLIGLVKDSYREAWKAKEQHGYGVDYYTQWPTSETKKQLDQLTGGSDAS